MIDEKTIVYFLPKATVSEVLGLRWSGIIQAIFIPLFLTTVLFLGPVSVKSVNGLSRLHGGQYTCTYVLPKCKKSSCIINSDFNNLIYLCAFNRTD